MMNKWRYELEDNDVFFSSYRSNGKRFVNVHYLPDSDSSALNDGNIISAKTCVPFVTCDPDERVSQRESTCAIILQSTRKYPTASENRNLGEFTADLKFDFRSRGLGYISRTCPGQAERSAVRRTHKTERSPDPL